jgi:hypothetical protein
MQIHELTKRQLNELDIAGPGGLVAGAKAALGALRQPGGAKDLGRTFTPGANQGLASTADLSQSDFAKRMQTVKNNAAVKQVAANMQSQWNQYRTTVSPMTQTTPQQQAQQQNLKSQLLAKKVSGGPAASKLPLPGSSAAPAPAAPAKPNFKAPPGYNASNITAATKPITVGKGQKPLDPKNPNDAALIARIQKAQSTTTTESIQLTEAAGAIQLADWYKKTMIPKEYATHAAEYLKNPVIQTAIKTIAAAENQPDAARQKAQATAFIDLVAATSAKSQEFTASNPQLATAAAARVAPRSPATQAAKTNIAQAAGMTPSQMDAIKKITSALGPVSSRDPATVNNLRALGFSVQ